MTVTHHRERPAEIGVFALPRETYISPRWFEREMALLFRPSWIFAGHVSEVEEAGQYLTVSWRDESAVILRRDEGQLVAHHNVCRHRGFRIFAARHGNVGKRIVCPYHGWCYELTGELRTASRMPEPFDRQPWGLKPVWLEQWHGIVVRVVRGFSAHTARRAVRALRSLGLRPLLRSRRVPAQTRGGGELEGRDRQHLRVLPLLAEPSGVPAPVPAR